MSVISLRDIHHGFGQNGLFEGVNLDVDRGEITALMGPNGSGKSVLLRIMCRLMAPKRGTVTIDPSFLPHRRVYPDRFGVSIDGPAYLPGASAERNLRELASIRRIAGPDAIRDALDAVGLAGVGSKPVRRFSMGMKQKLAIAQAIMENQEVLLLDEPFNALDEESSARIVQLLVSKRSEGATIVFTSHDRRAVDAISDRAWSISSRQLQLI